MQTIGLLGGMSWESTLHYYRLVNEGVKERLGGLHSARVVLLSVDFAPIAQLQAEGRWDEAGEILASEAARLEQAGADFLVLCTNTMHRVAPAIEARVRIPLLHIADPTAAAVQARGIQRVGLLGTRFTMEQPFYVDRLRERGLDVLVPPEPDRVAVHQIIYDELCLGRIEASSRAVFRRIAADLVDAGAQGVIFGCTEIGLLLAASDVPVPTFDTTVLHAAAAVERSVPLLSGADVVRLVGELRARGVRVWVDGGWGVDALLGRQTRPHADLDLAVARADVASLEAHLVAHGFAPAPRESSGEGCFVMCDPAGRAVDVHAFEYDEGGAVVYGVAYPFGSLTGAGHIDGHPVECVDARWMFTFKTGYPPAAKDLHDVAALAERFGFAIPPTHRR